MDPAVLQLDQIQKFIHNTNGLFITEPESYHLKGLYLCPIFWQQVVNRPVDVNPAAFRGFSAARGISYAVVGANIIEHVITGRFGKRILPATAGRSAPLVLKAKGTSLKFLAKPHITG